MTRPTTGGSPRVLAVDDNAQLLVLLGTFLDFYGVEFRTATGGSEAVEEYRRHRASIALVLLDVQMPGLDGPGTLLSLQALDRGVRCWFMSGDPAPYSRDELLALGACGLMDKPFRLADLAAVLTSVGIAVPIPAGAQAGST